MCKILVLYYSDFGHTKYLADEVANGVSSIEGCEAVIRTLPELSFAHEATKPNIPEAGAPYAEISDLAACDGLIFGSPTHFGHMASPLQHFFEKAVDLWISGDLIDKPFGVFGSSASLHGGHESTLLSMALPCLHLGMVYVGVPYSVKSLHATKRGGGPYGASQWSEGEAELYPSKDETLIAQALGARVSNIAKRLKANVSHNK